MALIEAALPEFMRRGQSRVYRSMLRAAVRKFDKTTRDFGDKDEWKAVLKGLQQDGVLTYSEASDTITLSAE